MPVPVPSNLARPDLVTRFRRSSPLRPVGLAASSLRSDLMMAVAEEGSRLPNCQNLAPIQIGRVRVADCCSSEVAGGFLCEQTVEQVPELSAC